MESKSLRSLGNSQQEGIERRRNLGGLTSRVDYSLLVDEYYLFVDFVLVDLFRYPGIGRFDILEDLDR